MARPLTIQLYLPDGNPKGLRISELTTSVVRVIEVPRMHLGSFQKLPESRQVGVYFLFGGDKSASGHVYVGQSSNVGARLATHNSKKDFWATAWVVVFNSPHFTPTHTLYMEYESIRLAQEAERFTLENGNKGQRPPISYGLQGDADNAMDTIRLLFDALQFPVFEPRASLMALLANNDLYYCSSMAMASRGHYTSRGFMVLAGSTAVRKTAMFIQARPSRSYATNSMPARFCACKPKSWCLPRTTNFRLCRKPVRSSWVATPTWKTNGSTKRYGLCVRVKPVLLRLEGGALVMR